MTIKSLRLKSTPHSQNPFQWTPSQRPSFRLDTHIQPGPNSSSAGRLSLGTKGMHKELRRTGTRTQHLANDAETEILLRGGTVFLSLDGRVPSDLQNLSETRVRFTKPQGHSRNLSV